ncbi:MAG TPA: hypothetical protein VKF37_11735 [Chloroflexota bacterium]|nr:hypothetical protein [Chloroflexota bacterium]
MPVYPAALGRCKVLCDPVAPDLVVEIASPHQSCPTMAAKAKRDRPAGVRQP